jgi:hypothetical protein
VAQPVAWHTHPHNAIAAPRRQGKKGCAQAVLVTGSYWGSASSMRSRTQDQRAGQIQDTEAVKHNQKGSSRHAPAHRGHREAIAPTGDLHEATC